MNFVALGPRLRCPASLLGLIHVEERMPTPPNWSEQFNVFVKKFKVNSELEEYLGERPFGNFVLTEPEPASSWNDYLRWVNELQGRWCFRGQRESAWLLVTSLDRAVKTDCSETYPDGVTVDGYFHRNRDEETRKNLERFREEVSRHGLAMPSDDDSGSRFALMQHYGTPTRFLDWSSSPYVAAYFALEKQAQEDQKRSVIWAIDLDWLEKRGRESLQQKGWAPRDDEDRARWENRLVAECHEPIIIKVNPIEPNDRMTAQQGILLCNLLQEAFFFANLMRMMIYPDTVRQPVIRKIEIDTNCRAEFLQQLEAMNIHSASLFPAMANRA
jgi:FRG domain